MTAECATVLGISGSERAGGNTDQALEYAGSLLRERGVRFETLYLRDHRISPCSPCGNCNSRPAPCVLTDDMPGLIARMTAVDGLIYAAPVHGFGLAHLMQIFIERAGVGYLRFERPLRDKVGGVIVTGRRYSDASVHDQIVNNLLLNRMILVGSGFPAVLRSTGSAGALDDVEGIDALDRMVQRMADMIALLRSRQPTPGGALLPVTDRNERVPRPRQADPINVQGDPKHVH